MFSMLRVHMQIAGEVTDVEATEQMKITWTYQN
jgi:hypothetical protein